MGVRFATGRYRAATMGSGGATRLPSPYKMIRAVVAA